MLRISGALVSARAVVEGRAREVEELPEGVREALRPWAETLGPQDMEAVAAQLLGRAEWRSRYDREGSCDMARQVPGVGRFRVNVYRQRGSPAVAARRLSSSVPSLEELFGHQAGLVDTLKELASRPRGLLLVTGPTGSGKSTTLAAMVTWLVSNFSRHVVTLEDPIEYLIGHGMGLVNQREVGDDVRDFAEGLRAALREDPDVIVVGEMRDPETVAAALTAAETGHLVLSTLHTRTTADAVSRVLDAFAPQNREQVRVQFAEAIVGVLAQQLLPRADRPGLVAAAEVLVATPAVRAMIREGRVQEVPSAVQTGSEHGMVPMDRALASLVLRGLVSEEDARSRCVSPQLFADYLGGWFRVR
jgi:twitching motility protein PilT